VWDILVIVQENHIGTMVWEDGIEGGKLGWMVRVGGFIIRMCPSIVCMVGWEVVVVGGSGI
jgi:hypothetical protein